MTFEKFCCWLITMILFTTFVNMISNKLQDITEQLKANGVIMTNYLPEQSQSLPGSGIDKPETID